jgi:hypothetical protein
MQLIPMQMLDQRVQDKRGATRIPVDHIAVSLLVQRRRSANVRERKCRRAGVVEHKTRTRRNAPAEIGFPVTAVVCYRRGKYYCNMLINYVLVLVLRTLPDTQMFESSSVFLNEIIKGKKHVFIF